MPTPAEQTMRQIEKNRGNFALLAGSDVKLTRNYLPMLIYCTGIVRVVQFAPT